MTWSTAFAAFGGAAVAVGVIHYLSKRLIEHQLAKALAIHQASLDKQLAEVQSSMARINDVLSRRNEREFAITEQAWELMNKAVGAAQEGFGPGRPNVAFAIIQEPAALRMIDELPFDERDKALLRAGSPTERDELFKQLDLRQTLDVVYRAWVEFKNFVAVKEIFLDANVLAELERIRDAVYGIYVRRSMYAQTGHHISEMSVAERAITDRELKVDLNERIKALAQRIRKRFQYD
jgi:hypothetical protein